MPREFTRKIYEGDNGQLVDTVYAIPNHKDLKGTIRDNATEERLNQVIVRLRTTEGNIIRETRTNEQGEFTLNDIPPGKYTWETGGLDNYFSYKGREIEITAPIYAQDTVSTGHNRVLINRILKVPGTEQDTIHATVREIRDMNSEEYLTEEAMGRGIGIYLADDFTSADSSWIMELFSRGDSLFYGETGSWIFGREQPFDINHNITYNYNRFNNYFEGELGWNITKGGNVTEPILVELGQVLGGNIEISEAETSFYKELYGRTRVMDDVAGRISFMNNHASMPTRKDRAYFKMYNEYKKARLNTLYDKGTLTFIVEEI